MPLLLYKKILIEIYILMSLHLVIYRRKRLFICIMFFCVVCKELKEWCGDCVMDLDK